MLISRFVQCRKDHGHLSSKGHGTLLIGSKDSEDVLFRNDEIDWIGKEELLLFLYAHNTEYETGRHVHGAHRKMREGCAEQVGRGLDVVQLQSAALHALVHPSRHTGVVSMCISHGTFRKRGKQ